MANLSSNSFAGGAEVQGRHATERAGGAMLGSKELSLGMSIASGRAMYTVGVVHFWLGTTVLGCRPGGLKEDRQASLVELELEAQPAGHSKDGMKASHLQRPAELASVHLAV
jgi:hypothetical protein